MKESRVRRAEKSRERRGTVTTSDTIQQSVSLLLFNVRVLGEEQVDVRLHDRLPRRGAGVGVVLEECRTRPVVVTDESRPVLRGIVDGTPGDLRRRLRGRVPGGQLHARVPLVKPVAVLHRFLVTDRGAVGVVAPPLDGGG